MIMYLYMDDGSLETHQWREANECVDNHPAVERSGWISCRSTSDHPNLISCLRVHTLDDKPIEAAQLAAYVKLQGYMCEVCNDNHG